MDVSSGVVFTAWHDAELPGLLPLTFRRYYSTALLDAPGKVFRHGWVYSLEVTLTRTASGYLLWDPEGGWTAFEDRNGELDAGGSVWAFSDSMELVKEGGRLVVYHWHGWQEDVHRFVFDAPVQPGATVALRALELPAGHALVFHHDAAGRVVRVQQSVEGRALQLIYNPRGCLERLELHAPGSSAEVLAVYSYDDQDHLVSVLDAQGAAMRYAYDASHRMIEETGRAGGWYRMVYEASGRCVGIGGDKGYLARTLRFDDAQSLTHVTDSLGHVTVYKWNARGQIVEQVNPGGGVERTQFDAFGRITARIGPCGEALRQTYSPRGDVASVAYPGGSFVAIDYNREHQPVLIRHGNGARVSLAYTRGALVSFIDATGAKTEFQRDASNLVVGIRTSAGGCIQVSRDQDWSFERYEDEFGLLRHYRFDSRLNVVEVSDARGLLRRFGFDPLGRLTLDETPDGKARRYTRTAIGLPLSYSTRGGAMTEYQYDLYGNRVSSRDANGALTTYRWDTEGRLLEVFNPKAERAAFDWDAEGNLTAIEFFDGRVERFTYDGSGRRLSRLKPDGVLLEFEHDEAGNLLSVRQGQRVLSTNSYDPYGRLVETQVEHSVVALRYDTGGRLVSERQNGSEVTTEYAAAGTPIRRSFNGGTMKDLHYVYDHRRRLVQVLDDSRQVISAYEFDAANLLVRRRFASLSEEYEYDERRRLTSQTVMTVGGDRLSGRRFSYDDDDNLVGVDDRRRGQFVMAYDSGGRLIGSRGPDGRAESFAYDPTGNLVRKSGELLAYAAGNRLTAQGTTRFERDANGCTTAVQGDGRVELQWNAFDQLTSVVRPDGRRTSFRYDGLGRRTAVLTDEKSTEFFWSGDDLICERTSGATVDYFVGGFVPQAMWIDGSIRHITLTHSLQPGEFFSAGGSLVSSEAYDVWGKPGRPNASPGPTGMANPLGFAGQYFDEETGYHYNRHRYYDSRSGRYLSPDPLGLVAGLNDFLYGTNPVGWLDPLGLACGQTHFILVENPNLAGRGGQPAPTRADWIAKRDAFNAGVQAAAAAGKPLTIPTPAAYAADRAVGNREARAARVAQGMGPGVQADHPVELAAGGGQGQALYPLASGVNGSSGAQIGPQAAARPPGSPTPMIDLVDQHGNPI